jgi:hypothetical protein
MMGLQNEGTSPTAGHLRDTAQAIHAISCIPDEPDALKALSQRGLPLMIDSMP